MPQPQTHYDALGVAEDASEKQIKAAFFKKVRQHPPEQDPDGYKAIREAYDVLSNPVARKEYDNMAAYGEEIKALEDEADALLQQEPPQVDAALKKLKKAVVLGPEIGLLRNRLGDAYYLNEEYQQALVQFNKAIDLDGSNPAYRLNKGHAQQELGRMQAAERTFRAVWEEDTGDYAAARALAGALFQQERADEAHDVLDTAIWDDGKLDFEDFFCYYDKLTYYVYQGETETLKEELDTVARLPESEDDRQFAAFMLGRSGYQLYELNVFDLAHEFVDTATDLDPENEALRDLAEHVFGLRGLQDEMNTIIESDRIHEYVKQIVALYYTRAMEEMSQHEFEQRLETMVENLDMVMQVDPDNKEIKRSLRRIRQKYSEAYQLNAEFFDAILSVPEAEMFAGECPHCHDTITAHKQHNRGEGTCPHCNREIRFTGSAYKKPRSSSYRSSSYDDRPGGFAAIDQAASSYSSSSSNSNSGSSSNSGSPSRSASTSSSTSNDGGDCFVATAVYDDYNHPDVMRLRAFRDGVLRPMAPGRAFIRFYYRYGPGWARRLEGHTTLKRWIRAGLEAVVRWLR